MIPTTPIGCARESQKARELMIAAGGSLAAFVETPSDGARHG
jgi:hypothetical protein